MSKEDNSTTESTETNDKWIPLRRAFHLQLNRDIVRFLKQTNSKYFHIDQDAKRLKCTLTGHEILAKGDALNNYLSSKKFKKALNSNTDWTALSEYLIQHPKYPDKFLCTLTNTPLTKNKMNIIKHTQSAKYQQALEKKLAEEEEKKKQEAEQLKQETDQKQEEEKKQQEEEKQQQQEQNEKTTNNSDSSSDSSDSSSDSDSSSSSN